MAYTFPGTPDKGAGYMVDEFLAAHGVSPNLPTMKAFARGILKALSEDETGFNEAAGTAATVSGGLVGNFITGDGALQSGKETVNATSGTVSFTASFSAAPAVVANGISSNKIQVVSTSTTDFSWDTSDDSNFNGVIHWIAVG